jgi:hypothetical protein
VGIILSFTLFITSVIFIYSIASAPISFSGEKYEVIDIVKNNFIDYNSEDIFIIRLGADAGDPCVTFSKPETSFTNESVFAKSIGYSGEIHSSITGNDITVNGGVGARKLYLTNSSLNKNLGTPGVGCTPVTPLSVSKRKIITEKNIIYILNELDVNYTDTKNDLGISMDHDVLISFVYANATEIGMEGREVKENIYANKYKVEYLSLDGDKKIGDLIIKLW